MMLANVYTMFKERFHKVRFDNPGFLLSSNLSKFVPNFLKFTFVWTLSINSYYKKRQVNFYILKILHLYCLVLENFKRATNISKYFKALVENFAVFWRHQGIRGWRRVYVHLWSHPWFFLLIKHLLIMWHLMPTLLTLFRMGGKKFQGET